MRTRTVRAIILATLAVAVLLGTAAHIGRAQTRGGNVNLLARLIAAEAEGEPYQGMVAVGAVCSTEWRVPNFPIQYLDVYSNLEHLNLSQTG